MGQPTDLLPASCSSYDAFPAWREPRQVSQATCAERESTYGFRWDFKELWFKHDWFDLISWQQALPECLDQSLESKVCTHLFILKLSWEDSSDPDTDVRDPRCQPSRPGPLPRIERQWRAADSSQGLTLRVSSYTRTRSLAFLQVLLSQAAFQLKNQAVWVFLPFSVTSGTTSAFGE